MNKHLYPAIFHKEDGAYWVEFPSLPGCNTEGNTFEEAYAMAVEALGLYLEVQEGVFEFCEAVEIDKSDLTDDSFVVMVEFDEVEYLKKTETKSVKKTLTIPKWLDVLAVRNNINFSQTLQNALMEQLNQ